VRASVLLAATVVVLGTGCDPRRPSTTPTPAAAPDTARPGDSIPWVRFDSGALVRVQLHDRSVVTGVVLSRLDLTPAMLRGPAGDERLLVCERRRAPCPELGGPGVRSVPVADIQRLAVRGRMGGVFGYGGFFLGALVGLTKAPDEDTKGPLLAAGGFGGMLLGGLVGQLVRGWVPVYPCAHGCAQGRYPER
jgi:hypothetical protein